MKRAWRHTGFNLAALAGLQLSNAVVPLLAFPWALAVLGAGSYAELAMAEAISVAVLTVVLYSFEIEGVARVAPLDLETDRARIAQIFGSILWTRLTLFAVAASIALVATLALAPLLVTVLALWLMLPLGQAFQSAWLFQAIEQNVPVAVFTAISRFGGLALVLLVVRTPSDVLLFPLILGGTFLVGGLGSCLYAVFAFGLRPALPPLSEVMRNLSDGWHIFAGNVAVMFYRDWNVLILGVAGVPAQMIADYSVAEKLVKVAQAGARPLTQLFMPAALRAISDMDGPDRKSWRTLWGSTYVQLAVVAVGIAIGGAFTAIIATTFFPARWPLLEPIAMSAAFMAPAVLFGIFNYMFGVVGLNYLGARPYMLLSIVTVGLLNLVICFALAQWLGGFGAVISFVLAEMILAIFVGQRFFRPSKGLKP